MGVTVNTADPPCACLWVCGRDVVRGARLPGIRMGTPQPNLDARAEVERLVRIHDDSHSQQQQSTTLPRHPVYLNATHRMPLAQNLAFHCEEALRDADLRAEKQVPLGEGRPQETPPQGVVAMVSAFAAHVEYEYANNW